MSGRLWGSAGRPIRASARGVGWLGRLWPAAAEERGLGHALGLARPQNARKKRPFWAHLGDRVEDRGLQAQVDAPEQAHSVCGQLHVSRGPDQPRTAARRSCFFISAACGVAACSFSTRRADEVVGSARVEWREGTKRSFNRVRTKAAPVGASAKRIPGSMAGYIWRSL